VAPETSDYTCGAFHGTTVTFDDAEKSWDHHTPGGDNPRLFMFEAIEGSKVGSSTPHCLL
jgi:hypothetical protein